jgi:hypothetical protein
MTAGGARRCSRSAFSIAATTASHACKLGCGVMVHEQLPATMAAQMTSS